MQPLTTAHLQNELLQDTLLTLEQLTTGVTALALNTAVNPEHCPRVRTLLSDLVTLLQRCEADLSIFTPLPDDH